MNAVEEFAVECSLTKIFGSEVLGFVTDEAVQIHGGYGYHQDYAVERLYRDARIYRIFEGTNEINRVLATTMLLKRARGGRLKLPADSLLNLIDESQQEVVAATTDVLMYTFAIESADLRAQQAKNEHMFDMAEVFREFATTQIESAWRLILAACKQKLPPFARPAVNLVPIRRRIAARLLDAGKYTV